MCACNEQKRRAPSAHPPATCMHTWQQASASTCVWQQDQGEDPGRTPVVNMLYSYALNRVPIADMVNCTSAGGRSPVPCRTCVHVRRTCNEKLERTRQARSDKRRQLSSEFEQVLSRNHRKEQKAGKPRVAMAAVPAGAGGEWWEGSSAFSPTAEGLIIPQTSGYGGGLLTMGLLGGTHVLALDDPGLAAAGMAADPAGGGLASGPAARFMHGGLTLPGGVVGLGSGLGASGSSLAGLGLGDGTLGVGLDTWITGASRKRAAPGQAGVGSMGGKGEAEMPAAGDGGGGGCTGGGGGEGTFDGEEEQPDPLSARCDGGSGFVRRAFGVQGPGTAELALVGLCWSTAAAQRGGGQRGLRTVLPLPLRRQRLCILPFKHVDTSRT